MRIKLFLAGLSTLLMSACVTTNVYFPAAAVEKAADKIVADVWPQADKVTADKPQVPFVTKQADKPVAVKKEKK